MSGSMLGSMPEVVQKAEMAHLTCAPLLYINISCSNDNYYAYDNNGICVFGISWLLWCFWFCYAYHGSYEFLSLLSGSLLTL